ncbi:MAG: PilN domain-containing protein [Armatimonadota bacterium]|nr:PilN domain-containing protein [Armatimonadota bacterium]
MIRINLLPRVPRRRIPGRQFIEVGVPLVALVAVVVLSAVISGRNARLQQQIDETNREIADLQPTVARVLDLDRRIAVLREKEKVILELVRQQMPAAAVLNEIRLLVPRTVWLTSMSVPDASSLSMEGFAMNYYAVAELMDNLGTGQLFRLVDLSVVQLDRVGPREVVKFSITARIVRPSAAGGERQ